MLAVVGFYFAGVLATIFTCSLLDLTLHAGFSKGAVSFLAFFVFGPAAAYRKYRSLPGHAPPQWICTACGSTIRPARKTRGSMGIEIVLWCCFILPGLLYSLWRLSNKYRACPLCGSPSLVPLHTPVGQKVARS